MKRISHFPLPGVTEILVPLSHGAQLHPQLESVLEWDVLDSEHDFQTRVDLFRSIQSQPWRAIRVVDVGVMQWLMKYDSRPIQLVLEHRHRNRESVRAWARVLGTRLDRIVLSPDMPRETIQTIARDVPCEILGEGHLLLFRTPRHLILNFDRLDSIETGHRDLRIRRDEWETRIEHPSAFSILDHVDDISNVSAIRIEPVSDDASRFNGFFLNNQTDAPFVHLKNSLYGESGCVGEIIDACVDRYAVLRVFQTLCVGDGVLARTPDRREIEWNLDPMKRLDGTPLHVAHEGAFVRIPWRKGLTPRTRLFAPLF